MFFAFPTFPLSLICYVTINNFGGIMRGSLLKKLRMKRFIYKYTYSHPQTDCFVLSELFSVVRHAGRSKPGSKPVQRYVRLCFRPLVHQADNVS